MMRALLSFPSPSPSPSPYPFSISPSPAASDAGASGTLDGSGSPLGQVLVLGATCFIAETLYGFTSFGPAILFNIGFQVCYLLGLSNGSLKSATVNLTVMELAVAMVQAIYLRKHLNWRLFLACAVPACVSVVIGSFLLVRFDSIWMKRGLAALLGCMAVARVAVRCCDCSRPSSRRGRRRGDSALLEASADGKRGLLISHVHVVGARGEGHNQPLLVGDTASEAEPAGGHHHGEDAAPHHLSPPAPPPPPPPFDLTGGRLAAILCFFSVAGFMGGMFGVAGPPIMIFVAVFADALDLRVWRSCSAGMRVLLNVARGSVFLARGEFSFDTEYGLYAAMISGGLLGLVAGNYIARFFRATRDLHWFIVSFLTYGGILIGVSGEGDAAEAAGCIVIASCASLSLLALACYRLCPWSRVWNRPAAAAAPKLDIQITASRVER